MQIHVRAPIFQARVSCSECTVASALNSALITFNSALHFALVPQQLQGGFRKPVFVGASPTRGPIKMQNAE